MKVIRETPNLYRLVGLLPINCFLVQENDGLTLVDTGMPGRTRQILAAATQLGASIPRIALTHAHQDHVGSLDKLAQKLPGVEVSIGAREARLLARDFSLDVTEPPSRLKGRFPKLRTLPTRQLNPGDWVGSLKTIATPGHTPGHISFLDVRDGTLLAGDAFQSAGGVAVAGVIKKLFPLPAFFTWDRHLALKSARILRWLDPTLLAPGHGPAVVSPQDEMDYAIECAVASFNPLSGFGEGGA